MPSIAIHLATANEYLKKHPEEDAVEFLRGAIAPDYVDEPTKTHHSSTDFRKNGLTFLKGKIRIKECLGDFDFNSPYGRGYFFHLVTDHEFYQEVWRLGRDYAQISFRDLKSMLYNDYNVSTGFLKREYGVVFPDIAKEYDVEVEGATKLLSIDQLGEFVERVAGLDLGDYLGKL